MNAEELREACEMAGLIVENTGGKRALARMWQVKSEQFDWSWCLDDPALPAYVAELLVAKVRERGETKINEMSFALAVETDQIDADTVAGALCAWEGATAEDRIRAAMAVLKERDDDR